MKKRINTKQIKKYIEKYSLTGVIRDEFISEIEIHEYKKGEMIYQMKDELKYLYFLVEGKVLIHLQTEDGKEMHLDFGEPLDLMGDLEFINSSGIYSNVEAIKDTLLLAMPRDIVDENAKDNSKFYEMISKFLGKKLILTSKKYTQMILYPLKNRIASYIYDLSAGDDLIEGFRQMEVALSYGISDRHLRRVLNELEDEMMIEKNRDKIKILDRKRLKKLYLYH